VLGNYSWVLGVSPDCAHMALLETLNQLLDSYSFISCSFYKVWLIKGAFWDTF